ncbi:hypothetical protein BN1723_005651 [Verticillium longisporum]|uniref:Uncharacterized protein n=1 Tax=Verticillium longisporum TaxID=100787 RepID=A0A0G4NAN2_VERLO|nr:hypothetical protein BN1723_005651 [Verticillium longisporum]
MKPTSQPLLYKFRSDASAYSCQSAGCPQWRAGPGHLHDLLLYGPFQTFNAVLLSKSADLEAGFEGIC